MVAKVLTPNSAIGKSNPRLAGLFEFSVIGVTFWLACNLLAVTLSRDILTFALIHALVNMTTVRLSKHFVTASSIHNSSTLKAIIGNAAGLSIGAALIILLTLWLPIFAGLNFAITLSVIMAFFVLGTVAPLFKLD